MTNKSGGIKVQGRHGANGCCATLIIYIIVYSENRHRICFALSWVELAGPEQRERGGERCLTVVDADADLAVNL